MSSGFDLLRLPTGLQLLGERRPARSVAVGLMFDVGARDEAPDESGAAHLLEHLAFKGDDGRDADDVNRAFDELGAEVNAFTSHERTFYYGAALAERRGELTDLLLRLPRPALRREDVARERSVVLEEIGMMEDQPGARAFDLGAARFFRGHPLGRSVLGSRATVAALGPARLAAFRRRWYGADRALMVVSGAYDWDQVVAQAEAATADWGPSRAQRAHPAWSPASGASEERGTGFRRAHVTWFAAAPAVQEPARLAAALLARVVGDDVSGRLFWALVDPGWVDEAALWFEPADRLGSYQGYAATPDRDHDRVVERFDETLARFQREGPTADEWSRAQRAMATEVSLSGETPMGRLATLAEAWLDRGEVQDVATTVDRVLSTSLRDGLACLEAMPFTARFRFSWRPAAPH